MNTLKCPKCSEVMQEGFVLEMDGGASVSQWVEGTPVQSMWTGVKIRDQTKYRIQTYRCTKCGFLESYARGA